MTPAPIAVQIVTWNHAHVIDACLESLAAQSRPAAEIVVVDNASSDDTLRRVERLRARLPQLVIVAEPTNTGFCAAQNTATERTTAPTVFFLNPDTRLPAEFLETAAQVLDAVPADVGAVAPCLVRPDGSLDSTGLELDRFRRPYDRDRGGQASRRFEAGREVFGCTGAAALLRREMLDDVGGPLDPVIFAYCDDMDLAWRARLKGWRCQYEPRLCMHHERMARNAIRAVGTRPTRGRDQRLMVRNRLLVMARCERPIELIAALPWLVPFELARMMFLAVRVPHALGAYAEALLSLPSVLRTRRSLHGPLAGGRLGRLPWRVR